VDVLVVVDVEVVVDVVDGLGPLGDPHATSAVVTAMSTTAWQRWIGIAGRTLDII
jgi:hypothetical protein